MSIILMSLVLIKQKKIQCVVSASDMFQYITHVHFYKIIKDTSMLIKMHIVREKHLWASRYRNGFAHPINTQRDILSQIIKQTT